MAPVWALCLALFSALALALVLALILALAGALTLQGIALQGLALARALRVPHAWSGNIAAEAWLA